MNSPQKYLLAKGVLWASAILAAAFLGSPTLLTLIILPTLSASAFLLAPRRSRTEAECCL